jgi:hypothetical protein
MTHANLSFVQLFRTVRHDAWWIKPLAVILGLSGCLAIGTWAAVD